MKRVSILGAAGSIGKSTAKVLAAHADRFRVEAVVGGRDAAALADVAIALGARCAAIADPAALMTLKARLADTGIEALGGDEGVLEAARRPCDITVAAITGIAGLRPTHAALAPGRRLALANKECLVSAGGAFMRDAAAIGAEIVPLDSEHNAIQQAIGGADPRSIETVFITASGGPFLRWSTEASARATVEDALKHPTWAMGAKITIDSATMMNKGLELIEAHHLFGTPPDRLDVIVHPQSIVHGLVEFRDGSTIAVLARPDMRVAISYGLGMPDRLRTDTPRLHLAQLGRLDFEAPDLAKFPALAIAREALAEGGAMPTVLNAANEVAVEAFLSRRLAFGDIPRLVRDACGAARRRGLREPATIGEALELDGDVRLRMRADLPELRRTGS